MTGFFEIEASLKHLFLVLLLDRFARLHICNWLANFIFIAGCDFDLSVQIYIAKFLSLTGFQIGLILILFSQIRLRSMGILLLSSFSKVLACICYSTACQLMRILRNNWASWTILTLTALADAHRWPLAPSLGGVILSSLHR